MDAPLVETEESEAQWRERLDPEAYRILFDPQTSGGLLLSVPAERAQRLVELLKSSGVDDAAFREPEAKCAPATQQVPTYSGHIVFGLILD